MDGFRAARTIRTVFLRAAVLFALAARLAAQNAPQSQTGANDRAQIAAGAIIAWAIAGLGMLTLAFVFQNLAIRKPQLDNGVYVYARQGFGLYPGFLSAVGFWASACAGNTFYWVLIMSTLSQLFRIHVIGYAVSAIMPAGRAAGEAVKAAMFSRFVGGPEAGAIGTANQSAAMLGGALAGIPAALGAWILTGTSMLTIALVVFTLFSLLIVAGFQIAIRRRQIQCKRRPRLNVVRRELYALGLEPLDCIVKQDRKSDPERQVRRSEIKGNE